MTRLAIPTVLGLLLAACAQTGGTASREREWPIPAVRLDAPVHFGAQGKAFKVPAGSYRVEASGDALRLTALAGRQRFLLKGTTRSRTAVPKGCAVVVGSKDIRQLALTRPDGVTLAIAGTLSGARLRGITRQNYYDPEKTHTWNTKLKRVLLAPADFAGTRITHGGGSYVAYQGDYFEVSAFAPIHLPPGAWIAGIQFSWIRDWEGAGRAYDFRNEGQEDASWLPMTCILWSRDFAQREVYTVGFVDTLAAFSREDETNPRQLVNADTGEPLETQANLESGGPSATYSAPDNTPLVIGHSAVKLKRKVKTGDALWIELRLPPVPNRGDVKPGRRVLAVAVEYYIPNQ